MKPLFKMVWVGIFLFGIWGGLTFITSTQAQTDTAYDNLEVVIALDLSGSMSRDDSRQSLGQVSLVDIGYALLPLNTPATDRTGERFDVTRNNIQWLARQLQSRPELAAYFQVHTAVVGFDETTQTLMDWTVLNTVSLANLPEIQPTPPQNNEVRNSDFIALYTGVNNLFSTAQADGTARRVLVIITDSLPCKPVGTYSEQRVNDNLQVYNSDCMSPNVMTNHLQYAHSQLLQSDIVPIVLHISDLAIWDTENRGASLRATHAVWENETTRRAGAFMQLNSINELPQAMFDILAEQLTLAIAGGDSADDAQIGRTLGLVASTGSFEVPPYQEYLEMLLLSRSATLPTITANGESQTIDEPIFASNSGTMRYLRFNRPRAGTWTVQDPSGGGVNMRIMYRQAESQLSWESADPTSQLQYQPVRLVYTIHDPDGVSWIDLDYEPIFTASVQSPVGESIPLEMTCDVNRCVSETFLPLYEGAYNAVFDAQPQPDWPEITIPLAGEDSGTENDDSTAGQTLTLTDQYTFLKPNVPLALQVGTLTFWRQVGDTPAVSSAKPNSITQINQPRSETLSVKVWVGTETTPAELPPGLSAQIIYDDGVGCPAQPERVTALRQEGNLLIARPELRFDTGECSFSMTMTMTSDLKPIGGVGPVAMGQFELANVISTVTARLSLALLDEDGKPLDISPMTSRDAERDSSSPDYTMFDYVNIPEFGGASIVSWPQAARSIEIAFLDEAGQLIHPHFMGEAGTAASENTTAPIPFKFSIVRADGTGNLAEDLGIELTRSEKEGVYVAELTNLEAGNYFVQFELLVDSPDAPQLDTTRFEYASSLTSQTGNPLMVASLRVNRNLVRLVEIYGALTFLACIVIAIFLIIFFSRRRRVAPLSGTLALYRLPRHSMQNGGELEPVWDIALPTKRNTMQVPRRNLLRSPDLTAALFNRIMVTTRRQRDVSRVGGAYAELTVGSQDYLLDLKPNEPRYFYTDQQGARFYAVKFTDETETLPASAFGDLSSF
ncbi:MAG: hypothetical protein JXA10_09885 [Anaerolineae bacterium]|nr:hypothetical protein [Anaerolineae bacterium]